MKLVKTILFILICIGLIWLGILLIRSAFSAMTSSRQSTQINREINMSSFANSDAIATLYVDGPIQADPVHQAVRITVTRNQSKIELIEGYEGKVVRQEAFESNSTAYEQFLKALENAGFDKAVNANVTKDERGMCPLGFRYIYRLDNGSDSVVRSWSTSCSRGNATGDTTLIRNVFRNQIPEDRYREVLRNTRMYF